MSAWDRWWVSDAFTLGLCTIIVLLAVMMTPSTGFLHLGPLEIPELCTWRRWFGVQCPGCGLTRSFVFMGHGQPLAAFAMNKLGPFLFLVVASQIPYRLWRIARRSSDRTRRAGTSGSA